MPKATIIDCREVAPGRYAAGDLESIPDAIRRIRQFLKGARMAADVWGEIRSELDETIEALNRRPATNPRRPRSSTRKPKEAIRL